MHADDVVDRDDYLHRQAPALLRVAHQLTGDPARAVRAVVAVAATLPRRGTEADLDRVAVGRLTRRIARARLPRPRAPLGQLDRGARATAVIGFGLDWPPEAVAAARRRPGWLVRREARAALTVMPADAWRAHLDAAQWTVTEPGDLTTRARRRRRTLAHRGIAAGCAATAVAAGAAAIVRVVDAPASPPPTAHGPGLLTWAPRGDLIRSGGFVTAAVGAWRRSTAPPLGPVYVLFAGRVGRGRLAVLEARGRPGPRIAVVGATATGPVGITSLATLHDTAAPAVAFVSAADGGGRAQRLLVAPDVIGAAIRPVGVQTQARPDFTGLAIHHGLTSAWPAPEQRGAVAVRLIRSSARPFVGLLPVAAGGAVAVTARSGPPPARWAGLPHRVDAATVADDVLWWAQWCARPDPVVRVAWVGRGPAYPAPIRLELVSCAGGAPIGSFLTGSGSATFRFGTSDGYADAFGTDLSPPDGGHFEIAVVGSRRVTAMVIGGRRVRTRVAVVPTVQARGLQVFDRRGRVVPVR